MDNNQLAVYLMQNIAEPLTTMMNRNQKQVNTKLTQLGDQLTSIENRLDKLENRDRPEGVVALAKPQLSLDSPEGIRYKNIEEDVINIITQILEDFPFSDQESKKLFVDNSFFYSNDFVSSIYSNANFSFADKVFLLEGELNSLENPNNISKGEAAKKVSDKFIQLFTKYNKPN